MTLNNKVYEAFGIPDEQFVRSEGVPMTKNEIRVLSLAKLQLTPAATVYDIGAGSGSVAIEIKRMVPDGKVIAIEKNPEAIKVLKENSKKFKVAIDVIEGLAPDALEGLPVADRIFIGGSGGNLEQILRVCDSKLTTGGRIVLNSVTLNTATDAYKILEELGYEIEVTQVAISYIVSRGNAQMWQARNPVTIIAAAKTDNTKTDYTKEGAANER
ncbi:precorrin-6Y C5,15-methyltransferase (decarboxylating) subunit CbiT [Desulfuribacillus alkaliarsenatis]|uniref:Precorrin-6Y C5,15-methyltransferase (Decarboxylating) subunit CbiT n=1 Tax=Desulfuribacillus alkaliarsenatis TaxID=766136 RepID=A0A1E5G4I0_9FIRM|nr:precorrin-6Y C5,15-methyltransferase (decarboxylating) subunit CbiT [Desulfuribacillus alkaliarsenatis]OEF97996.1 precorrin-6Y C5,15-methyltransferase (decarboxylating) subunit CbiT [Desulfuribacillus alkaliarsenatis]